MNRQELLQQAIALKTLETHAALTAKAISAQTESKVTRANYDHYQGHYKVSYNSYIKKWCNYFYKNESVSNERLMLFLIREVLFEPPKKRGRKSQEQKQVEDKLQVKKWTKINLNDFNSNMDEVDLSTKVQVKIKTVQGYVTAICDLYQFQSHLEGNKNALPRSNQIKKVLDSVKKLNLKVKDESFEDRLKNTSNDIISTTSYIRNATYLALKESAEESVRIADRLDQLLLLSLMARSQIT